ncbi:hypothetical protein C8R47DRAFT_1227150 [Mycena vitilis]|nr:hypothetical protein C8R47DRAFT_1227150 [Mycena vitilis]
MASGFNLTLGPIINAGFFALFFFGLITMQTEEYIRNHFRNDLRFVKYFVVALWFAHLLFAICICAGVYTLSVTDFAHTIELLFLPWGLNAAIVIGNVIDHAVQAFFVTRVYRVTGALYVSICLWITVAFLRAEAGTRNSSWLISALFFGDASLDVVMASVLIYYLKQQSRSSFESTVALLNRLVRYTIQTGLATSFVAMGAALSAIQIIARYLYLDNIPNLHARMYVYTLYESTALPINAMSAFTIALLANINARRSLIQPKTVALAGNPAESAVVINYSRSVVYVRDPVDPKRPQHDQEDGVGTEAEQSKRSGEHRFFATSDMHVV